MKVSMKELMNKAKIILGNYFFIIRCVWDVGSKYLVVLMGIAFIGAILPMIPLFLMKQVMNILSNPRAYQNALLLTAGLLLFSGGLDFSARLTDSIRMYISNYTVALVEKKVNLKILKKASTIDLENVESKAYYFKLDNARRALGRRWDTLILAPVNLFSHTITLISLIGILSFLNKYLAIVLIIGVLPNIVIQIKIRNMMNELYTNQLDENRKMSYLQHILADKRFAKEVRLFNIGEGILHKLEMLFDKRYEKINQTRRREMRMSGITSFISFTIISLCQIVIAGYVITGKITIGDWALYTGTLQSINYSLSVVVNIVANSYEEKLFSSVLQEFLEVKSNIILDQGEPFLDLEPHSIQFENVSFRYPDSDKYILKDISFTIQKGDKIALVGLNGAGKTTLIKLLSRLYNPTEGKILFDGKDIQCYQPVDIYKMISIIFQDFNQYAFSLRDNIMISRNQEDHHKFEESIRIAEVDPISNKLPHGYDTFMTKEYEKEGITNISGGEWQKIGIARGIYRDTPIIILDEPTSNLDPLAEFEIYEKFVEICKNKTAVLISHRLSSVQICDKILFLKDGQITEIGSHHELLQKRGEYAYLFNLQAQRYQVS